jgi:hypothetical protein
MGTIVILTLKEALRRRAFLGTLIILVALYGLTFLPKAFHQAFGGSPESFKMGINLMILFGVDIIKFFSSVLAILLSAGAITSEIERGYLAAILPRPLHRFELFLGKWLGVMLFCGANALLWTAMLWLSVLLQGEPRAEMWHALPYVLLYPVMYGTLALTLSSFSSAPIASMFTVAAGAFAYFQRPFPASDCCLLRCEIAPAAGLPFRMGAADGGAEAVGTGTGRRPGTTWHERGAPFASSKSCSFCDRLCAHWISPMWASIS